MEADILIKVTIAFIGVSLISSATYVLNDLKDVNIDKLHPVKKNRPIASWKAEENPINFLFCNFNIIGFIFYFLNLSFYSLIYGILYLIFGYFYTIRMKFIPYLDMLTISVLFIIRVLIGGTAVNIEPSAFLTLFYIF